MCGLGEACCSFRSKVVFVDSFEFTASNRTFFPESRWEVERTQDGVMVRFKLVGNLCGRDNFVRISTDEPVQDVARSVCGLGDVLSKVVIR